MNTKYIYMITVIFLLSGYQAFAVLTPDQTKAARKSFLKGYNYFDKGEKAFNEGHMRQARAFLLESITAFEAIKKKYPNWNNSMIAYRLKFCKALLEKTDAMLKKQKVNLSDSDVDRENITLKDQVSELNEQLAALKKKLSAALDSLEAARREAARDTSTSAEVEKILKEKAELEKRLALVKDRNKQLEMQSGAIPAGDADSETKKALDSALIRIEELAKANDSLKLDLKKEKERFTRIAAENTQLKYENQANVDANAKTKKLVEELNAKIAENNEVISRWDKEKQDFNTKLEDAKKLASQKDEKLNTLKNKLDELRNSITSDTLTKQLENENEILSKDLELVHLQLAKILKEKKNLIEEKQTLTERIARLEKSISSAIEEKNSGVGELETLRRKMVINDTIIKRQDQALADKQKEYDKLKKEIDELVKKYKNIDKKEREFTELAKSSLKTENENRRLKEKVKKLTDSNSKLAAQAERAAKNIEQLQKDIQSLISEQAETEKKSLFAQDRLNTNMQELTKKNLKLSSDIKTYKQQIVLLKEETASLNQALTLKDKQITLMAEDIKNLALHKQPPTVQKQLPREPEIAEDKATVNKLKQVLAAKQAEIETLRKQLTTRTPGTAAPHASSPKPAASKDDKQLKKMLNSALTAEDSGKKEAAIWYYQKVLKLDSENNTALSRLGYLEAAAGHYEEAVSYLDKALKTDPDDVEKLQVLTVCYIRSNKFYKALSYAAKSYAVMPKDAKTLRYLGIIASNLNQKQSAEQYFSKSFKLDPTSAETAFNAAVLLTTCKGRMKEAALWYKKAVELGAERDPGIEKIIRTAE